MSHSFYYNLKYFQVISLDGRIIWDYSAYQHQLGIKTLRWSPDGKILALGSHDNKVRLFCSQFWVLRPAFLLLTSTNPFATPFRR